MISVVGGTYWEHCLEGEWCRLFGSGLRAAHVLGELEQQVKLYTYCGADTFPELNAIAKSFGITSHATEVDQTVAFVYSHALSVPVIYGIPLPVQRCPLLTHSSQVLLRFGFVEGDARVRGDRVIYDPQSPLNPQPFRKNGSRAKHLAIVANTSEAFRLTGEEEPLKSGPRILKDERAEVVVIKSGFRGAYIFTRKGVKRVGAFMTDSVWPIGSGDVFSASFAYYWGLEGISPETAARKASLSTAYYCNYRVPPRTGVLKKYKPAAFTRWGARNRPRVYLAGPFFTMSQRWLIHETRRVLTQQGASVFSPWHDVGIGSAKAVAPKDIDELRKCDVVLAVCELNDPGTDFEIGYARARGLPVIVYSQTQNENDMKMVEGTNCQVCHDLSTAVYKALWSAKRR